MNRKICAAVVGLLVLVGVSVADETYPHAFPRAGTVKLFDNDRVTIWEVNWLKNVMQPVHRHLYDMAGVYLRFGQITVTGPNDPVPTNPKPGPVFEVPRPYYQPKGITHREVALAVRTIPSAWQSCAISRILHRLPSRSNRVCAPRTPERARRTCSITPA